MKIEPIAEFTAQEEKKRGVLTMKNTGEEYCDASYEVIGRRFTADEYFEFIGIVSGFTKQNKAVSDIKKFAMKYGKQINNGYDASYRMYYIATILDYELTVEANMTITIVAYTK